MILDFGTSTENPEVLALKKKVLKVANEYKRRYNWCNEVDNALEEIGISQRAIKRPVTVEMGTIEANTLVNPDDYIGKSEQEQKEEMVKHLSKIMPTVIITTDSITDMRVDEEPEPPETDEENPNWRYISSEGRVLHLMAGESGRYTRCGRYLYAPGGMLYSPRAAMPPAYCAQCRSVAAA